MKTKVKQSAESYTPKIEGEKDFYDAINKALKSTNHKNALLDIIKKFEAYKKFMSENLMPMTVSSDTIFTFRFAYQLKKNVWKDIEVYGGQSLAVLAEYLIEAMGWSNDHLDAFYFPEKRNDSIWKWYTLYEIGSDCVDNDQYPILHTDDVYVASIDYTKHPILGFVFDFGDDHRFIMGYKGIRDANENDQSFPKIVDQRGVAPEQYPESEE